MLGKFQTDQLEERFGSYRRMSGANYHVSVQEILESERRLKLISLLKLKSHQCGEFTLDSMLHDLNEVCSEEKAATDSERFEGALEEIILFP